MEQEGLLTMEVEYQESHPNRKVYRITEAGREELRRWLREPQDLSPIREAFLSKVFFGAELPKEEILAQLRTLETGIKSEEAWIAWCEEAIRRVEALEETSGIPRMVQ